MIAGYKRAAIHFRKWLPRNLPFRCGSDGIFCGQVLREGFAARELGVGQRTLRSWMRHLGVRGNESLWRNIPFFRRDADEQVARCLRHCNPSAHQRVQVAVTPVAVGLDGNPAAGPLQSQHGGVAARPLDGVEEQLVVVLRPDPREVLGEREQVGAAVVG